MIIAFLSIAMNIFKNRVIIITGLFVIIFAFYAQAQISGQCSNCHTMHNSQDGNPMNFDNSTTPNQKLLRSNCLGCHAQGTPSNIVDGVPQVLHSNATDLAGGNFGYILGTKGSGADDTKGHNVIDLGNLEDTLTVSPGARHTGLESDELTCAGKSGCHGERGGGVSGIASMSGSHHQNAGPKLNTADEISNSYRFLMGVKGYENNGTDAWENRNASNHNEYFGANIPMSSTSCDRCHYTTGGGVIAVKPANFTMSGFCATCHWYFHSLDSGGDGIGDDTTSPFIRHPTDVILPNSGEYTPYTNYSVVTPVARTTVPDAMSSTVVPGSDVVMCLTCHRAHATDYYKMLRWDYKNATLSTAISGCSNCHTDKD